MILDKRQLSSSLEVSPTLCPWYGGWSINGAVWHFLFPCELEHLCPVLFNANPSRLGNKVLPAARSQCELPPAFIVLHYFCFTLSENSVALSVFITMLCPSLYFSHSTLYMWVPSRFSVYWYFFFLAMQYSILWICYSLSSFPGEGNSNLLQYSCLENSMGRGAGGLHTVQGVAKSRT